MSKLYQGGSSSGSASGQRKYCMKATSPLPRDAYSWLPMAGKMASERNSGAGDLEEALPVALVAAAVDEVAGEDGEIGLLVGERAG